MILICPCCGATASAEAWLHDPAARAAMQAMVGLPKPVETVILPYLGLFRPEKRALTWRRAEKLITELSDLVKAGYVQIHGNVARDCPPDIWAAGMDQMINRASAIQRPLKNHNYLRQVAWQLADEAGKQAETARNRAERHWNQHADRRPAMEKPEPLDVEWMKKVRRENMQNTSNGGDLK